MCVLSCQAVLNDLAHILHTWLFSPPLFSVVLEAEDIEQSFETRLGWTPSILAVLDLFAYLCIAKEFWVD